MNYTNCPGLLLFLWFEANYQCFIDKILLKTGD